MQISAQSGSIILKLYHGKIVFIKLEIWRGEREISPVQHLLPFHPPAGGCAWAPHLILGGGSLEELLLAVQKRKYCHLVFLRYSMTVKSAGIGVRAIRVWIVLAPIMRSHGSNLGLWGRESYFKVQPPLSPSLDLHQFTVTTILDINEWTFLKLNVTRFFLDRNSEATTNMDLEATVSYCRGFMRIEWETLDMRPDLKFNKR